MGKREAVLSSSSNTSAPRAMSQENVEIVRRAYELLAEGLRRSDPGHVFDTCVREGIVASDIEVKAGVRGGVGIAGIRDFAGRDGWVEFMRAWSEDFDDFVMEAERIVDAGDDRVLVLVRNHGTGKGSGAAVEARFGAVYTIESGRIVRGAIYVEPSHALHAVGLRE